MCRWLAYSGEEIPLAGGVYTDVARMVGFDETVGRETGIEQPMQMTLGISEGKRLFALRYSSESNSRTLFYGRNVHALEEELGPRSPPMLEQMTEAARCVVSEPLSDLQDQWEPIP